MHLETMVESFIREHTCGENRLIVGVSGGIDSMVLMHALIRASRQASSNFPDITVVHVHHGLRETADKDAQFVQQRCRDVGVPCRVCRIHLEERPKGGVEAAAREARYEAILEVAGNEDKNPVVVLAHHQDDQVETFLLRWLRGTGLHGLGSMRQSMIRETVPVLRPLLSVSRREIEEYAAKYGVAYVEDESNSEDGYTRNYLRHKIVPLLHEIQPELGKITERMTESLQVDDEYLHREAAALFENAVVERQPEFICIDTRRVRDAHLSLQRRVIHILLNCFTTKGWTRRHIDAMLRLLLSDLSPSATIDLGHGLHAGRNYDMLYIGTYVRDLKLTIGTRLWTLSKDSALRLDFPDVRWRFRRVLLDTLTHPSFAAGGLWCLHLPAVPDVWLRFGSTLSGLRVRPLGLGGSKKLQDIFTDKKIPRVLRSQWPVFSLADEILWVPGVVRSEAHAVPPNATDRWVILAHLRPTSSGEIGTLSSGTRRMIRE